MTFVPYAVFRSVGFFMANGVFKLAVLGGFPDGSSAKIGRAINVNQRTVQKWLADEATAPAGAIEDVSRISSLMQDREVVAHLQDIIDDWRDNEGHPEALASALAAAYFKVTGRRIE